MKYKRARDREKHCCGWHGKESTKNLERGNEDRELSGRRGGEQRAWTEEEGERRHGRRGEGGWECRGKEGDKEGKRKTWRRAEKEGGEEERKDNVAK